MKNQWFGDIHDFRKYGLLHFLCRFYSKPLTVWMKTPDIPSPGTRKGDGLLTGYTAEQNRQKWAPKNVSELQQDLWEKFNSFFKDHKDRKDRTLGQAHAFLPENMSFFTNEDDLSYERWNIDLSIFLGEKCPNADLIFFDPDNGVGEGAPTTTNLSYIFTDTLLPLWKNGNALLLYQHRLRFQHCTFDELCKDRVNMFKEHFETDPIVIKGSGNMVFFLLEHSMKKKDSIRCDFIAEGFSSKKYNHYLSLWTNSK